MNAVLKFKKKRNVPKAQSGLRFTRAGTTTWGNKIWADVNTGDLYTFNGDPNDSKYVNRFNPEMKNYLGKSTTVRGIRTGLANPITINGSDYIRKPAVQLKKPVVVKPVAVKPRTTKVAPAAIDWNSLYRGFVNSLTQDLKDWLVNNNVNFNDATSMLNFLASKGQSLGKWGVDGKWGGASQAAWQNFVNSGAMAPKEPIIDAPEIVEPVPTPTPVIDAVDPFGYESKGNYSLDNAGSLKTDGIRDWTTMMNYIRGNQDSAFSQDMMHRFGNDLSKWNQQDIESAMGVSGNYGRRDRSRIQGFMAGNLASWNNQRQAAINDFAKKTFLQMNQGASTLGNTPGMNKEQLVQSMEGLAW